MNNEIKYEITQIIANLLALQNSGVVTQKEVKEILNPYLEKIKKEIKEDFEIIKKK